MRKPKVIAEIGINHNGQIDIALQMIREAHAAGAWAVKFQMRDVKVIYADMWNEPRNDQNPYGWKTQGQQKAGLELSMDEYNQIDELCESIGMPWFASAWDLKSLENLTDFKPKYHKIASAMLSHQDFVRAVASLGKKTFISIGGATKKQIDFAMNTFNNTGTRFVLMHCVALYPVPYSKCNISRINDLVERAFVGGFGVGYSGHEVGILPSIMAMTLGANYVERHITLDRSMYGSDQSASLEMPGLIRLVEYADMIGEILGTGDSRPQPEELEVLKKLRYWEVNNG
jgi:N-acetylneuraminate synthase